MLPESIVGPDGALLRLRLELQESSGPVTPRFQYETHLVIEAGGDRATLSYTHRGHRPDAPPGDLAVEEVLPRAHLEQLWRELRATGALERSADLVGEERRRRVGVSFNRCTLQLGDEAPIAVEYLPSLLRDEGSEGAPLRRALTAIRTLGEERATAQPTDPPLA